MRRRASENYVRQVDGLSLNIFDDETAGPGGVVMLSFYGQRGHSETEYRIPSD
jgi:hypothetical protein